MTQAALRELYQEMIIDHSRHPRHFGQLDHATHHADGVNPLCGDTLALYLIIENNIIRDISFTGQGCAISTASASLLTEALIGKNITEAHQLFSCFHQAVTSSIDETAKNPEHLGKLTVLVGVKEFPARVKCATLAWHTLEAALRQDNHPVSTE